MRSRQNFPALTCHFRHFSCLFILSQLGPEISARPSGVQVFRMEIRLRSCFSGVRAAWTKGSSTLARAAGGNRAVNGLERHELQRGEDFVAVVLTGRGLVEMAHAGGNQCSGILPQAQHGPECFLSPSVVVTIAAAFISCAARARSGRPTEQRSSGKPQTIPNFGVRLFNPEQPWSYVVWAWWHPCRSRPTPPKKTPQRRR